MKANPLRQKHPGVTGIVALVLMLAPAALLLWSPGIGSNAQQESNRQLERTGSASQSAGKRVALVIGNGAYTSAPPLKNPPNDARDMAATLRALGFDVTNGINVNQRDMKRLIREFGQKLKTGGSGLFYYAGHGVQSKGRNYLIPVDAEISSETDVEDQAVDLNLVLGLMDEAGNGLNIVILDACRNNPFARSFRSAGSGLAQVDAPTGTLIAYATSPGRVASDGQGRNGLYTSELLRQMRVPGIGVEEMFKAVRASVKTTTKDQQTPWESSSLVGAFCFAGGCGNTSATNNASGTNSSAISQVDPAAIELSYWETIKNSTSPDDFKAYLEKYPDGQFASLARNRIKSLETPPKPTEAVPTSSNNSAAELTFWDSIKNSTNVEDFRAYLKKYPNGEFGDLARNRINTIAPPESGKVNLSYEAKNNQVMIDRVWPGPAARASLKAGDQIIKINGKDLNGLSRDQILLLMKGKEGTEVTLTILSPGSVSTRDVSLTRERASLLDKEAEDEFARQTKSFEGTFGIFGNTGTWRRAGKLVIYPSDTTKIRFNLDEFDGKRGYELSCSAFDQARLDGVFIREVDWHDKDRNYGKARFQASSPAEAATALEAIRALCKGK